MLWENLFHVSWFLNLIITFFFRIITQISWCKTNFHFVKMHLGIYYELILHFGKWQVWKPLFLYVPAFTERINTILPCFSIAVIINLSVRTTHISWACQKKRWNNFNYRIIITISKVISYVSCRYLILFYVCIRTQTQQKWMLSELTGLRFSIYLI